MKEKSLTSAFKKIFFLVCENLYFSLEWEVETYKIYLPFSWFLFFKKKGVCFAIKIFFHSLSFFKEKIFGFQKMDWDPWYTYLSKVYWLCWKKQFFLIMEEGPDQLTNDSKLPRRKLCFFYLLGCFPRKNFPSKLSLLLLIFVLHFQFGYIVSCVL